MQAVITVLSALMGGFVGGWVVAFRLGRWRQRVEDRLENIEKRAANGDRLVDQVPVLITRIETLVETTKEIKQALRDGVRTFVTREECNRRHGDGG